MGSGHILYYRHCEERSDEAIQRGAAQHWIAASASPPRNDDKEWGF